MPLGKLEVGTVLHVQGGGEAILVSKTWRQGDFEVFDFEVEGLHNFYVRGEGSGAAGVLVHNSTAEGSVDMIRAVSTGELDDIATSGVLRGNPSGASLEGKQFGLDLGQTVDFADAIGDADAVIKVSVPQSTFDALDKTGVDSTIFKSGTATAQPGAQLDLVNDTKEAIEVVYP